MKQEISFFRILTRISFLVVLFLAVSQPNLSDPDPEPFFRFIKSKPPSYWLILFLSVVIILWLAHNLTKQRKIISSESPDFALEIEEAVKEARGGNGLASAPFSPTLGFLNLVGWINVKSPQKECVVIDGVKVIERTQLFFAPMRLFGKPINARRVLLNPDPLTVSEDGKTLDHYDLTLNLTVSYSVIDPTYVSSLSDPLKEFTDFVKGRIVEIIGKNEVIPLIQNETENRRELTEKISQSLPVKGHYQASVIKTDPTGDNKILEIKRKIKEETLSQEKYDLEGRNKVATAGYDLQIKQMNAEFDEVLKQKEFDRVKQLREMEANYEMLRDIFQAVAQISAVSGNASGALKEIRSLISQTSQQPMTLLINSAEKSLIEREIDSINSNREKFKFKDFEVNSNSQKADHPGSARFTFEDKIIEMNCPVNYPIDGPEIVLKAGSNSKKLNIQWFPNSNLLYALSAAINQAKL